MKVDVIRSTDNPERLVCQAARGDYFEGYVGDTEYYELMESVDYDDSHIESAIEKTQESEPEYHPTVEEVKESVNQNVLSEAATAAFIEKQLSRGHYGPFEHPQITFSVKGVSRVTMAQITRHRHITFDIQSMRYADFSEQEIITPKSLTDAEHFSRETGLVEVDDSDREYLEGKYHAFTEDLRAFYHEMIDAGVPKEDARFILPLGTTVNMTFSGNARAFLHLLDMRRKADAQREIRELSEALLDELFEWMSYTFEYYKDHGPNKLSP